MFRAGFFQKPLALCNGQINTCYLLLFLTVDFVFVATLILTKAKSKGRCLRKKKNSEPSRAQRYTPKLYSCNRITSRSSKRLRWLAGFAEMSMVDNNTHHHHALEVINAHCILGSFNKSIGSNREKQPFSSTAPACGLTNPVVSQTAF